MSLPSSRRRWLQQAASLPVLGVTPTLGLAQTMSQIQPLPPMPASDRSALVRLGNPLRFPHDHGAHPDTRTEWWYLTGSLQGRASASSPAQTYGFQITFFRSRVDVAATPCAMAYRRAAST